MRCRERYLLVATPRSGNTWLRRMLATALDLVETAAHRPADILWRDLPERVVIQLHWPRTNDLLHTLEQNDIVPLSMCRHPLDVLISILHFCNHERQTSQWINGHGGSETSLNGKPPVSPEFAEYATSARAAALLDVSAEWIAAGTAHVRYEDLVQDTVGTLRSFTPTRDVTEATLSETIAANSLSNLRPTSSNHHFWQGRPGLWERLIPGDLACLIEQRHIRIFEALGYAIAAAQPIESSDALQHWHQLIAPSR